MPEPFFIGFEKMQENKKNLIPKEFLFSKQSTKRCLEISNSTKNPHNYITLLISYKWTKRLFIADVKY